MTMPRTSPITTMLRDRIRKSLAPLATRIEWETFEYRPGDLFIVSYPKSGNTWISMMVAELLTGVRISGYSHLQSTVLSVNSPRARCVAQRRSKSRIFTSHVPYRPEMRRVIYVVRDPRSVAVSAWYYVRKKGLAPLGLEFPRFLRDFLQQRHWSQFGSWRENVGSWVGARNNTPGFLLLRYEDARSNPLATLERVADFCGAQAGTGTLEQVVEHYSLPNVQQMETLDKGRHYAAAEHPGMSFARKGDPDEWRGLFGPQEHEQLVTAWGPLMAQLGYETARTTERP